MEASASLGCYRSSIGIHANPVQRKTGIFLEKITAQSSALPHDDVFWGACSVVAVHLLPSSVVGIPITTG